MIVTLPLDLICVGLVFWVAAGAGRTILRKVWGAEQDSPGLELVFSIGIGLAILSYIVFVMGVAGWLYGWTLRLMIAVMCGLFFREMKSVLMETPALYRWCRKSFAGRYDILLALLGVAAAASNLVFNYSPPTQVREMLYDLTAPKLYLSHHSLIEWKYQKEFYYPMQIQMLYTLVMGMRNAMCAKLVHFLLGIFAGLAVYSAGRRFFSARAAGYAAVIFYLMPVVTSLSGTANVDLGTLFYGLAAFSALAVWAEQRSAKYIALSGILAGLAAVTKVTGITVVAAGCAFIVGNWRRRESFSSQGKQLTLFCAMSALAFAPWVLRNWHLTGNPVAPFSVRALGWEGHEAADLEVSGLEQSSPVLTFRDRIRLHRNLIFGDFIFGWGPLLFAFLPLGFMDAERRTAARRMSVLAFLNFAALYVILPYPHRFMENRYYVVTYAFIAVISGAGMEYAADLFRSGWTRWLTVCCFIFPCLTFNGLFSVTRLPLLFGRENAESYLRRKLPVYEMIVFANKNLPAGSRVLMLGSADAQSFYWDAEMIYPPLKMLRLSDSGSVMEELKQEKITHVLVLEESYNFDAGAKVHRHLENTGLDLYWDLDEMKGKLLNEIFADKTHGLYAVKG